MSLSVPEVWTAREAVLFTLRNNPDSTIAKYKIDAADSAITMQKAAFYPHLALSSRYGQTDNPMYSFGNILNQGAFSPSIDFNDPGRTDDFNVAVKLSYRLYNGGRDQAGIEAAEAQEYASQMALLSVQDQLAFNAVRIFNLIIQAEGGVAAHRTGLEAIDASLAVAKARYGEGVLLKTDLLNLEVQQSRSQENVSQAENGLEVTRKIFLNLLGLADGVVQIDDQSCKDQEIPAERTINQRPELKRIDAMIRAAEARVDMARGGRYPTVDGYAGYDLDQGTVTGGGGTSWQAGVQLNLPLFDGHHTDAALRGAEAMLAKVREQRRKVELAIGLEVKQAELAIRDAETRLAVTEKTVEQARESARIHRARFKEGEILASDLIGVENGLTDALLRRTLAETAQRIAIADLRRALGLAQFSGESSGGE
ncbi:MAG: TolC family protein [Proteobacteria bacterium]|nr:TolC family protein [Pseudomonadota bacterium]MBU1685911.1 TolC family protein [Pseudomonadota bacterium]